MNFLDCVERMRHKPLKTRRLAAFAFSLTVTGILFVVWLSFLLPDFFKTEKITQQTEQKNTSLESASQQSVFQTIGTAWSALGAQFSVLKSTVGSSIQSTVNNANLSASLEYQATSTSASTRASTTVPQ